MLKQLQMERKRLLLCLLFVSVLIVASEALVGNWRPIKNLKDPQVKEIAKFAVKEYNLRTNKHLKFQSILKGESQVVAGTNYRLDLAVKNGAANEKYEAVVYERSWEKFRNLTSFVPITKA